MRCSVAEPGPVCVLGGINLDIHLKAVADAMRAHTSNPARARVVPGGVARNVAENLARWSVPVVLLGAVGDDPLSDLVLEQTAATGVDVRSVDRVPNQTVGLSVALLDHSGELALGASCMDAAEACSPDYVRRVAPTIRAASLLVVDANLSASTIAEALVEADVVGTPVVIDPVSVVKAARLATVPARVVAITPNRDEARFFTEPDCRLASEWLVVSMGAEGVQLLRRDESYPAAGTRLALRAVHPIDVTGAGDALIAGIACGLRAGLSMEVSVRIGLHAARETVLQPYAVATTLNAEWLRQTVREITQ